MVLYHNFFVLCLYFVVQTIRSHGTSDYLFYLILFILWYDVTWFLHTHTHTHSFRNYHYPPTHYQHANSYPFTLISEYSCSLFFHFCVVSWKGRWSSKIWVKIKSLHSHRLAFCIVEFILFSLTYVYSLKKLFISSTLTSQ